MLLGNGTNRHAPCRVTTDLRLVKKITVSAKHSGRRHALSPSCPSRPPAMWPFACCPVPFSPCPRSGWTQSASDRNWSCAVVQICCPRSLRGATAPTATSVLPSSESQRANITGKTHPQSPAREIGGLCRLLLPFPMISHEPARVWYSPGKNLTMGPCPHLET